MIKTITITSNLYWWVVELPSAPLTNPAPISASLVELIDLTFIDPVTYAAPNITTDMTVNKVSWTELGSHADSWPTAPDHDADPSFVSVANT